MKALSIRQPWAWEIVQGIKVVEFQRGSAEDLPVDDVFADFVCACDSFDHWRDKERVLSMLPQVANYTVCEERSW